MYDIQKVMKAHSVAETLELLEQNPGAVLLAGGTDVMIRMRERKLRNAVLISIREIPELCGVSMRDDGALIIGSATCFDDLYRAELIKKYIPMLSSASNQIGSPQIRHIATIGGNICNGAVSADSAPSLLALDAVLEFVSQSGTRFLPITDFYLGPGQTRLQTGAELLKNIIISRENYENWGGCYLKFGQRNAMEISTLGCAAAVKLTPDRQKLAVLRLAFGVAASKPLRCPKLERAVAGMELDDALYAKIRAEVLSELSPRDSWRASKELREQLIKTQSVRAVEAAVNEGRGK